MVEEQNYMRRAIRLAKQGIPWASPNPLVGAVIVKKGRVIGEGCHARCGGMHAERAALKPVQKTLPGLPFMLRWSHAATRADSLPARRR